MTHALELEFAVDAPVAHAFEMWTARVEMWWPRDHTVSRDSSAAIVFEPRAGGRIYERAGFVLDQEDRHTSFGHDLVEQTWSRSL